MVTKNYPFRLLSLAYQKAVREQRMRTEISQAKREANFYLENVDKNKAFRAMDKRKRKRNSESDNTKVSTPNFSDLKWTCTHKTFQ